MWLGDLCRGLKKMAVLTEKQVFIDILQNYKELPCLWDRTNEYYTNKAVRQQSFQELLEKYKLCEPDAQIHDLKRRLENMRATYRRERVKVLKSRLHGGNTYKPTLWYYDFLKFLDEDDDQNYIPNEAQEDDEEEEYLKIERRSKSPPSKKKKSNLIFLTEDEHDQDEPYTISNNQSSQNNLETSTSAESFGRTVGLQLYELQPLQRFIAEKLISDVIFYGRLDKLRPGTTLNLHDNDF